MHCLAWRRGVWASVNKPAALESPRRPPHPRRPANEKQRPLNDIAFAELSSAGQADRASNIRRALNGRSISLVGMMGVGKSTIGKRLSQLLDIEFVDADKEIEAAAGMDVTEIFEQFGEQAFRSGEQKVIRRLMDEGQKILATGGGAFEDETTRDLIQDHTISVWLDASLDVLMKRVQRRNDRPLLQTDDPEAVMKRLLEERNPTYAHADIRVESRAVNRDVIAGEIIDELANRIGELSEKKGWT